MSGIGTLNEKPLHAALKEWYFKPGDEFEVPLEGYFIDIVRGDLLLEIQTGNFASIKTKLNKLLKSHQLRLIYPIAREKWIVKLPKDDSEKETRRKSPKRGEVLDVFRQMVSISHLMINPNFSLEVLLIREEELRRHSETRGWRRRGWMTEEHRLLEVVSQTLLDGLDDWKALLPESLAPSFTARDLAEAAKIRLALAQRMAYCLSKAEVITLTGKQGRANLYEVSSR